METLQPLSAAWGAWPASRGGPGVSGDCAWWKLEAARDWAAGSGLSSLLCQGLKHKRNISTSQVTPGSGTFWEHVVVHKTSAYSGAIVSIEGSRHLCSYSPTLGNKIICLLSSLSEPELYCSSVPTSDLPSTTGMVGWPGEMWLWSPGGLSDHVTWWGQQDHPKVVDGTFFTDTGRQRLLSRQVSANATKPTELSGLILSGINPDITTYRITIFSHSLSQAAILQLYKPETQNSFLTPPSEVGWPHNSLFKPSSLGA